MTQGTASAPSGPPGFYADPAALDGMTAAVYLDPSGCGTPTGGALRIEFVDSCVSAAARDDILRYATARMELDTPPRARLSVIP